MSAHTPGPWHVAGGVIRDGHDHDVAQIYGMRHWEPGFGPLSVDEQNANANLIAAAPDLLEACRETLRVLEDPRSTTAMPHTARMLKAAIAKAEGK